MASTQLEAEPIVDVGLAGHHDIQRLRVDRTGEMVAARRATDDRLVMLRILSARLAADETYMARLRRDVGRLAEQPHATVVEPHAFIDTGALAAVESEFADGVRVDELLRRAPLPPEAATVAFLDILDGLAWLHHLGVAHLDVAPATVTVEARGVARLADAGVAAPTFRHGTAPGTPSYMAPELWEEADPTNATDIYAASATAYELYAGRPPFRAARLQALRAAHLRGRVDLTRLPEFIAPLIAAGLSKSPDQRPPSAPMFRDAVRRTADRWLEGDWITRGRSQLALAVICAAEALPSAVVSGMAAAIDDPRERRRRVLPAVPALPPGLPWKPLLAAVLVAAIVAIAAMQFWSGGNGKAVPAPAASATAAPTASAHATAKPTAVPRRKTTPKPAPSPTPPPTPPPLVVRTPRPTATPTAAATTPPLPT